MRRRQPAAAVLAAAAVAIACAAPTMPAEAPAYDPTALTGGRVYRWPLGRTIAVYVHAEPAERGALARVVEDAAAAWRAALRYRELAVRVVDHVGEADVVVGYRDAAYPVALDLCGGIAIAAAATILCPAGDSARTLPRAGGAPGRVKVAVVIERGAVAAPSALRAVVTHELGHAFGIGGHSDAADDVMHPEPRASALSARDARTLRYVLHRPADLRL